jgi:hypothetical protein
MKTVIEMAREAGFDAESDTLCQYEGWVEPLTRFAALVLANNPPQSFMSWQEGYAAGVATENEACAKLVDYWEAREGEHADAIRARMKK